MRNELEAHLMMFAATFARFLAAVVMLPLPWSRPVPPQVRIVFAMALTALAIPAWPRTGVSGTGGFFLNAIACEVSLGLAMGVVLGWLGEITVTSMQLVASQAGFGFAAMIDPTTQSDSTVLQLTGQLAGWLILVAAGADREIVRLLALSVELFPPGTYALSAETVQHAAAWTSAALVFALRLALPVILLLGIADSVLALAGRFQPHLQLVTLAFPVKTMSSIWITAWLMGVIAVLYPQACGQALSVLRKVIFSLVR